MRRAYSEYGIRDAIRSPARAIRLQQHRSRAVGVVIGDDVECDTLDFESIDQMGIGGKMPYARSAVVENGDVPGPHRQQRPAKAGIADAAAGSTHSRFDLAERRYHSGPLSRGGPRVRRLAGGGRRIRTLGPRL